MKPIGLTGEQLHRFRGLNRSNSRYDRHYHTSRVAGRAGAGLRPSFKPATQPKRAARGGGPGDAAKPYPPPPHPRPVNPRDFSFEAGIVYQESGFEIIGSIDHHICAGDDLFDVLVVDVSDYWFDLNI